MFNDFFSFTPTLSENGSYYIVSGVNFRDFENDLKSTYGTSVIASRVLSRISSSRFRVHKFFTVELAWILDDLINKQAGSRQRHYRVGINKYRALYEQVKTNTWVKTTYQDYEPYDLKSALSGFKIKPYPDQQAFLENYSTIKFGFQLRGCLLDAAPGSGKANWVGSKILTPHGFTTMGDLKVGDLVIGKNGKPTRVNAVYPQGKKQLYKVTFKDGRSEEVCGEHLWTIKHCNLESTVDTHTLINYFSRSKTAKKPVYVPLMDNGYDGPVPESQLKLDPYLLGLLIGDGCLTGKSITFTTIDEEIKNALAEGVSKLGYKLSQKTDIDYRIIRDTTENSFAAYIKLLGLHGKLANEKFIPDEYLNTTYEARLALLQGLMDTDGTADEKGTVSFSSSSKELAEQVQYLVRSLGGIAHITSRIPTFTHKDERKEGQVTYRVNIRYKDTKSLFRLTRKIERVSKVNQYSDGLSLEMVSIEPSRFDDAQCISVDALDHLYICGEYIVTHNTPTSLMWSRMISKGKTIILVPKHLIEDPWVDHLDPSGERYCFSKPPKYWLSTDNSDPLKSDAEFFIFYTEQVRKDNWKGIPFTKIIDKLSKSGSEPAKMIIDESHNYNDFGSQQTRGMVDFASNLGISDVLFMSGTPLKAQGKETYPMFIVLDKYFDVNVREDFKKMYSRDNFFLNEMLAHRLGRIKFTINAINGMEDPPKPEVIPVSFPGAEKYTLKNIRAEMIFYIQERAQFYQKNMNNYIHDWKGYVDSYEETLGNDKELLSELAQYRNTVDYFRKYGFNTFTDSDKSKFCKMVESKIEADLRGEDLRYFRHIVPAIKYLGLKLRGEALGNVLGKARIGAIVDSIEYLNLKQLVQSGIKKTAIYSTYIEAIDTAFEKLKAEGCNPIRLHSGDKADVNDVIKRLRSPTVDSLVTSFDTLSEGTPLLMCNQLLLLNAPWRDYQLKQTIARIYRRGQDAECFVWLVDLDTGKEENITTRTIDIMEYFKEQVDQLLNGGIGFDTIEGVSTKISDNESFDFNTLIPFDIPVFSYRPKFPERSFSSMFR